MQINSGLGQVDKVTQQNTAIAEETASSTEELNKQVEQLVASLALDNGEREEDNYLNKKISSVASAGKSNHSRRKRSIAAGADNWGRGMIKLD